ncbi:MAG TPA: ankyrin repeat domain-containing protein [Thermoanaerobaculia bacterium]|nr:ankyrin repeat domain-containing protein [Thermoanaerobaculia bacterium]
MGLQRRHLVSSVLVLLLACDLGAAEPPVRLSDVFVAKRVTGGFGIYKWERFDIYDHDSRGKEVYVGTVRSGGPEYAISTLGGAGLTQKTFAVAADGRSIVFRHAGNLAPRKSKLEGGIYRYEHGGTVRLLHSDRDLESSWTRWPKPIPPDVLPFGYRFTSTPKDLSWALTAAGDEFPLALLHGEKLHEAAFGGRTAECVALAEQGAALNATTYWGFTPLELAIIANHEDTAIRLLELGADPNLGMYPPLHEAVELGRRRAVEALLAKGAKVSAADQDGFSPLHLAVFACEQLPGGFWLFFRSAETRRSIVEQRAAPSLIRLLLEHGADPDLPDRSGKTPLDVVKECTPPEARELLLAASKRQ